MKIRDEIFMNRLFDKLSLQNLIVFLIVSICIALPLFYHAHKEKLFLFDEAYYFIASYEYGTHGNFFIDFDPSSYLKNTKPYLFVFLQALNGKLFGWNEWSLRLPIILTSISLVWTMIYFPKIIFQNNLWGWSSGLLLLTAPFFVNVHMAFTGDHDVPLTLLITWFIIHFYLYLFSEKKTSLNIFIACLFAALSVLTKGWMVLFFMPACVGYLIAYKRFIPTLKDKGFRAGTLVAIILTGSWYIGRELADPGYLNAVWTYEIGRYTDSTHPSNPEWSYYWNIIPFQQIGYGILCLIPMGILMAFYPSKEKPFLIFSCIQIISFLCLISFSNVKLLWYDAPVLPLIVFLCGFSLSFLIEKTRQLISIKNTQVVYIILLLIFIYPYYQLFQRKFDRFYMETYGSYMMTRNTSLPYTIVKTDYNPHLIFYSLRSSNEFNTRHPIKTIKEKFLPGEKILVCEPVIMLDIKRHYEYLVTDSSENCTLLEIKKSTD